VTDDAPVICSRTAMSRCGCGRVALQKLSGHTMGRYIFGCRRWAVRVTERLAYGHTGQIATSSSRRSAADHAVPSRVPRNLLVTVAEKSGHVVADAADFAFLPIRESRPSQQSETLKSTRRSIASLASSLPCQSASPWTQPRSPSIYRRGEELLCRDLDELTRQDRKPLVTCGALF